MNIRSQPFYTPLDPEELDFDEPNLSYEETVLFMVANFQYLVTCMAFSVSKPFRKPIYTNYPFFFCVVFLAIFNTLCVFLPADSSVSTLFDLQPLQDDSGKTYYEYRYFVFAGILINSAITFIAEKLISRYLTTWYDKKVKTKK